MNKRQKTVVLVGLALIVLMGLFPPWIHSFVTIGDDYSYQFERFAGYSLLFNPPEPGKGQTAEEFTNDMIKSYLKGMWETRKKAAEAAQAKGGWTLIVPEEDILNSEFFKKTVWTPRIDIVRLLIQWALIIFVISGIFIFLKDEKE